MKRHCKTYHNEFYSNNLIRGKRQRKEEINVLYASTTPSSVNNDRQTKYEKGGCADHQFPPAEGNIDGISSVNIDGISSVTPNLTANDALPLTEENVFQLEASSDESGLFFLKNQHGCGMEYLVGKACFGLSIFNKGDLDQTEVQMLIQTAELVSELSHQNRERLCALTKSISLVITRIVEDEMQKKAFRSWKVFPITTMFDMRRVILEGSTSLLNIIAKPAVKSYGGFGYVLPSHCIQDALGHGFDLEFVKPEQNGIATMADLVYPINGIPPTLRCRNLFGINNQLDHTPPLEDRGVDALLSIDDSQLMTLPVYQLAMMEWADDFKAFDSTKGDRGSAHIKTLTLMAPDKLIHHLTHTYPLYMGHKKTKTGEIERMITLDLLRLASPRGVIMYSKNHGGMIRLRAKLLATLQDQPERRGDNYLLAGNSNYHRRFGFSFPWGDFTSVLRPCQLCRSVLVDTSKPWVCPPCTVCTNFAHSLDHPLLRYTIDGHFPFPTEFHSPMKLSYDLLCEAVSLSHDSFVSGQWESVNVTAYLNWYCIAPKTIGSILLHSEHCRTYQDTMNDPDSTEQEKLAAMEEKERHPNLYQCWVFPSIWTRGNVLEQHPDVPMHMMFLGVVKSTMGYIQDWMHNKGKAAPFIRTMEGVLESIEELKLAWIKMLPYKGGKFGGWVSENFLAISRVLRWFYSQLEEIAPDSQTWEEPDKPQEEWRSVDNRKWLQIRGLKPKGSAADLKKRVKEYIGGDKMDIPLIMTEKAGPVHHVINTIVSLDELISIVMVNEITCDQYYTELERKIRVFLTHFADMDERLTKESKNGRHQTMPSWISCYNFLCLLNIPRVVREYGPLRNLWEGGPVGEGFLRFVKPVMTQGFRRSWETSIMKTLLRIRGVQAVVKKQIGTQAGCGSDDTKQYHVYKSLSDIDYHLRQSTGAISCLLQGNRKAFGMACNIFDIDCFVPLEVGPLFEIKLGIPYFHWSRDLSLEDHDTLDDDLVKIGCILLPLLSPNTANIFTLVDNDHRYIGLNGVLEQ